MSRDAIADLVHRYADAVVHRDEAQWAATWSDDATWELGRGRRVEGRDAIVALWSGAMDGFNAVVQNVLNGTTELDEQAGILLAYYDDTYVRTDSGWCFASRELIVQYAGPPDLSAPFQNSWA